MNNEMLKPPLHVLGPNRTHARMLFSVGWFPESEFAEAVERWPTLKESWGADTYRE